MTSKRDKAEGAVIAAGHDIVPANHLPAPVVGWVDIPPMGTPLDQCPTSLDMTSEVDQVTAFNAMNAADMYFDQAGRVVMLLRDWLVYQDEGPDPDTGEVSRFVRVVLIGADGWTFRTTSEVVLDALDRLIRFKRQRRFDPPVPITVLERKGSRSGRTYHEMRLRVGEGS